MYCTFRTPNCELVEQRIASNFLMTGSDLHNLYTECLHQPGDYNCIDHLGIDAFMNDDKVKVDMNANPNVKWQLCNATLSKNYERDEEGSFKTYERLLRE